MSWSKQVFERGHNHKIGQSAINQATERTIRETTLRPSAGCVMEELESRRLLSTVLWTAGAYFSPTGYELRASSAVTFMPVGSSFMVISPDGRSDLGVPEGESRTVYISQGDENFIQINEPGNLNTDVPVGYSREIRAHGEQDAEAGEEQFIHIDEVGNEGTDVPVGYSQELNTSGVEIPEEVFVLIPERGGLETDVPVGFTQELNGAHHTSALSPLSIRIVVDRDGVQGARRL